MIEFLEPRIAPAILLPDRMTVLYQDVDGDQVRVKFSKPVLESDEVANLVFDFHIGTVDGAKTVNQQLWEIDLTALPNLSAARGMNITITAERDLEGGDGTVAVGKIQAIGVDLGVVKIEGDLGQISVGDFDLAVQGLKVLSVHSMGAYGSTTKESQGEPLSSGFHDGLGALLVRGDLTKVSLFSDATIGVIKIGGSVFGGDVSNEGLIRAKNIGSAIIGGSLHGGLGFFSGCIGVDGGKLGSITVRGSLIGNGIRSGAIFAYGEGGELGNVRVLGNTFEADGDSGSIISESRVGSVSIGGNAGGRIFALGAESKLGKVAIKGAFSGWIRGDGGASGVQIGGAMIGGTINVGKGLSTVAIGGDMVGGKLLSAEGGFSKVAIRGSILGDSTSKSGSIDVRTLGALTIGRDLRGGDSLGDGSTVEFSGSVIADRIGSVKIGGSIVAGFNQGSAQELQWNATIRANDSLGPVSVKGSVLGNPTYTILISGRGQAAPFTGPDVAIASIIVGGDVRHTNILAGFDHAETPLNADAQIGGITVGGEWIASSAAAGVDAGPDGEYGTLNDALITGGTNTAALSRIGKIVIKGQAYGTPGGTDNYGIVAQHLVAVAIAGVPYPLEPGPGNDTAIFGAELNVSRTGDFRLREIVAP